MRHFCTPNLHIFNLFTTVWVSGRPNLLMHNSPRPTIEVGAPFCQLPNCICYCHRHHYYGGNFATMTKPMIETFLINSNFRCKHYPFQLVLCVLWRKEWQPFWWARGNPKQNCNRMEIHFIIQVLKSPSTVHFSRFNLIALTEMPHPIALCDCKSVLCRCSPLAIQPQFSCPSPSPPPN